MITNDSTHQRKSKQRNCAKDSVKERKQQQQQQQRQQQQQQQQDTVY